MYILLIFVNKNMNDIVIGLDLNEKLSNLLMNINILQHTIKFNKLDNNDNKMLLIKLSTDNINKYSKLFDGNRDMFIENINNVMLLYNRVDMNILLNDACKHSENLLACPTFLYSDITQIPFDKTLIVKPIDTLDKNSHCVSIINDRSLLDKITYKYIIQPHIPHNNYIYKVYIINEYIHVTYRYSIDNIYNDNILNIGRISDKSNNDKLNYENIRPIQLNYIREISNYISKKYKIYFFGMDIIHDIATKKYYIIDINHMPSFDGIIDIGNIFLEQLKLLLDRN